MIQNLNEQVSQQQVAECCQPWCDGWLIPTGCAGVGNLIRADVDGILLAAKCDVT